MKFFTWRNNPQWIATAHAESVAQARELLLGEVGGIDGSCAVRAKARQIISEEAPAIWMGRNAEFALTDSAELEEQDAEVNRLRSELAAEKNRRGLADLAAGACREQLYAAQVELSAANERCVALASLIEAAYQPGLMDREKAYQLGMEILAADRKAQRAKGAAWALRRLMERWTDRDIPAGFLSALDTSADAIERGEVEVPE